MSGLGEHPHGEPQKAGAPDPNGLEQLSDEELEVELTIAAYAPGRLRWDRYQRLLVERLRRRLIAA